MENSMASAERFGDPKLTTHLVVSALSWEVEYVDPVYFRQKEWNLGSLVPGECLHCLGVQ